MLAERLEEWAHGYKAEGMQQGIQEGRRVEAAGMLVTLLRGRFGTLPEHVVVKINQSSSDILETWFQRAIAAQTLVDVFDDTASH